MTTTSELAGAGLTGLLHALWLRAGQRLLAADPSATAHLRVHLEEEVRATAANLAALYGTAAAAAFRNHPQLRSLETDIDRLIAQSRREG